MSTLQEGSYTDFILPCTIATVVAALICMLIYGVLLYIPLRVTNTPNGATVVGGQSHQLDLTETFGNCETHELSWPTAEVTKSESRDSAKVHPTSAADRVSKYSQPADKESEPEEGAVDAEDEGGYSVIVQVCLASLLVAFIVLVVVMWIMMISTNHRSAVDDLMQQLTNSTDTALKTSLVDAQNMVQKATNMWQFTGAMITDVANTSVWATDLLEGHYNSARLGALRFATTTGLEQSTNATHYSDSYNGLRVLSREFYGR